MARSSGGTVVRSMPTVLTGGDGNSDTTGAQIQTGSLPLGQGVYITNEHASAALLVGASLAQAKHKIKAGDCRFVPIDDLNKVYLKGSGATVAYTYLAL